MSNETTIEKRQAIRELLQAIGLEVRYEHDDPEQPNGHWFVVGGLSEFEHIAPSTFKMRIRPSGDRPLIHFKEASQDQADRIMHLLLPEHERLVEILGQ